MDFNIILVTSRSVTFELINKNKYFFDRLFDVYINDKVVLEKQNKNVFSIYNLEPTTEYKIKVIDSSGNESNVKILKTLMESITINVKDFGATGDGINDDTNAIQAAILSCKEAGRVFLPLGTYYVKPIFLKSNITIEFEKGAVLLGNIDRKNYPILPSKVSNDHLKEEFYLSTWEGEPDSCYASLITGIQVENVTILGLGFLDGNADNSDWWIDPKIKKGAWRPRTVFLNQCKNVIIQGMTIKNSPSWTLHPYFSENLRFIDLNIINPHNSPNTDGLDPESCKHVDIIGVHISVGDDCIAIKSGKFYMGQKFKKKSEQITIRNCYMKNGHGAVVLGSEMSGGIADINVSQCLFENTDRGLRIKTRRGRGKYAVVEKVEFSNISMNEVLTPFVINMFYNCDLDGKTEYVWSKEKLPIDDRTPYLGEFNFKDIICKNCQVAGGYFYGLPEQKIKKVSFENVTISFAEDTIKQFPAMMCNIEKVCNMGIFANNVKTLYLKNINITGYKGEMVIAENYDEYIYK